MTSELQVAGRDLRAARARLEKATQAARAAVAAAGLAGTPETEIARQLGVDRMTVRKWLGKR